MHRNAQLQRSDDLLFGSRAEAELCPGVWEQGETVVLSNCGPGSGLPERVRP